MFDWFFYAYRSIKSIKSKYLMLKNLWMKNDDISVSAWRPRRRDLHHFVSLPTNLKIWKNKSYPHIPHDIKNNLPWPKKLFSDFVSSKTTVRSGTSLDFCYCIKKDLFSIHKWKYTCSSKILRLRRPRIFNTFFPNLNDIQLFYCNTEKDISITFFSIPK